MKTIFLVCLALLLSLLSLSACRQTPDVTKDPSSAVSSSDPLSAGAASGAGQKALIRVEALSADDPRYEQALTRMDAEINSAAQGKNYPLPDGRTVINDHDESSHHILLRDTNGRETILVAGQSEGESYQSAHVYQFIDDSKFVYVIYGWEWTVACGLYDLESMEDHRFYGAGSNPLDIYANTLYSLDDVLYGGYLGTFHLTKTDLQTHKTTELLKDKIPEANLDRMLSYKIYPQSDLFLLLAGDYSDNLATDFYAYSLTTGELVQHIGIDKKKRIGGFFALSDKEWLLFSWPDANLENSMLLLTIE